MKRRHLLALMPFLLAALAPCASAQVEAQPDLRLDNFPAHVTTLAPEHLAPIRAAAQELVVLASGGKPVFVLTTGHADFDNKGRSFEDQISQQRGNSGLRALRAEFERAANEAGLSAEHRARVDFWDALALGTREALVKKPLTEAERRLNRRVEVRWWTEEAVGITMRRKFYGQ